jgi:hypothetical protein
MFHRRMKQQSVLESLRAAVKSIEKGEYVFMDWNQCTCGHIYHGVTGKQCVEPQAWMPPREARTPYLAALRAAARAAYELTGQSGDEEAKRVLAGNDVERLASAVSHMTTRVALDDESFDRRDAALKIIRKAIADIEAEDHAAQQAVLQQAQDVIDAAERDMAETGTERVEVPTP